MAKKYCKKSSLTSVANEVRTRNGTSAQIPFANIATTIENLAIPTQRGAPSTVLTASNPSTTVQRGKYTGGSVSVVPQNATATLTQNGGNVTIESGKTLASVTVPAKNTATVIYGNVTPSDGQTSISITGLNFEPTGYAISYNGSSSSPYSSNTKLMTLLQTKSGTLYGMIKGNVTKMSPESARAGVPVTSTTSSFGSNYVTISGVTGTLEGTNYSTSFWGYQYSYIVWG